MVAVAYRSAIYSSAAVKTALKPLPKTRSGAQGRIITAAKPAVSKLSSSSIKTARPQLKRVPKRESKILQLIKIAIVPTTIVAILFGTFFACFVLNVATSKMSIDSNRLERDNRYQRQDTQEIRLGIENKGTGIPQQAKELGMVPRGDTIMIELPETNPQNDQSDSTTAIIQKGYAQIRK